MTSIYISIKNGIGAEFVNNYDLVCDQHYHRCYELYYLVSGERTYIIDNRLFTCQPGDVVLVKPNVLHGTTGTRYSRYVVNFDETFLNRYFRESETRHMTECFSQGFIVHAGAEGETLFASLVKDYDAEDFRLLSLHLGLTLNRLEKLLLEQRSADEKREIHPKIAEIIHYIGEHYQEISNIGEIADHFYFSKYYLSHIFVKNAGVSIGVYLLNLRLANASRMLAGTDRPVSEISEACGFRSVTHFCNTFRKHTKMSPVQYRKRSQLLPENRND